MLLCNRRRTHELAYHVPEFIRTQAREHRVGAEMLEPLMLGDISRTVRVHQPEFIEMCFMVVASSVEHTPHSLVLWPRHSPRAVKIEGLKELGQDLLPTIVMSTNEGILLCSADRTHPHRFPVAGMDRKWAARVAVEHTTATTVMATAKEGKWHEAASA